MGGGEGRRGRGGLKCTLGTQAGPRFDTASALLFLQKGCGLWTLSCDSAHHFLLKR